VAERTAEFGCAALPTADPSELVDLAELAARCGYDRFWVPDQTFLGDPFLLLQRIAERTDLDLGIALTNPFSRHPMQIARSMATLIALDPLPGRRWALGIGKGNSNLVLGPLGIAGDAGVRRLGAAVSLIRALLRGETVGPDETGFFTEPVTLETRHVDCEVFIGTRGPVTLERVAPLADGVITESLFRPELVRRVRELLPDDGRSRPHVAWQSVVVLDEADPIPEPMRDFAALLMRTTAPAVLEALEVDPTQRERIANRTLRTADVSDDDVRRFVAIGTPAELRLVVTAALEAGATSWSSIFVGDLSALRRGIERFAVDVMAPIRAMRSDLTGREHL